MKFVYQLTEAEQITLTHCMRYHNNSKCRIRAHVVLLSARNYKINEIADIYQMDRDTIGVWLNSWEKEGIVFLYDIPRTGRPNKLTEEEQKRVVDAVAEDPRSIKRAIGIVKDEFDKEVSSDTIKRILKRCNQVWKRIRTSLKSKRDQVAFAEIKLELSELNTYADDGIIDLHYFDESGFSLTPVVPYAWQPKGSTIEVPAARSAQLNVLGFINTKCDFTSFVVNGTVDSDAVIACFDSFCETISKPTWIVVDNAPTHTATKFKNKRETWEQKGLYIYYLPAYSPELNIIEIVWRFIKYQWMPFSAYLSSKNLANSLDEILKNLGAKYRITFA